MTPIAEFFLRCKQLLRSSETPGVAAFEVEHLQIQKSEGFECVPWSEEMAGFWGYVSDAKYS